MDQEMREEEFVVALRKGGVARNQIVRRVDASPIGLTPPRPKMHQCRIPSAKRTHLHA